MTYESTQSVTREKKDTIYFVSFKLEWEFNLKSGEKHHLGIK